MKDPPTPDATVAWLLGLVFGSPSLVVTLFVFVNCLWAWWSLGRDTVKLVGVMRDRTLEQPFVQRLRFRASMRLALAWTVLYGVASFITQIWAGSQYSKKQGGGLGELLMWSALFGVIAVFGCFVLAPDRGPQFDSPRWAPYGGMGLGYMIGLFWAVMAFSSRPGGPKQGDWWICPALSCVGVLGASLNMRIKAYDYWRKHPTVNADTN